jgi:hypothetical protein
VNSTASTSTEAIEDNICDVGLIQLPLPGDLEAIGHGFGGRWLIFTGGEFENNQIMGRIPLSLGANNASI